VWCTAGSTASERISRLLFTDEQCLLSCGRTSGILTVWDLRAGLVALELPRDIHSVDAQAHVAWTCDRLTHSAPLMKILSLASDGNVSVTDVRSASQNRELMSLSTGLTFPDTSHSHMTIRVCRTGVLVICYVMSFPSTRPAGWRCSICFLSAQPDTGLYCETTASHIFCVPVHAQAKMPHLLLVLIAPAHRGL